MGISLISPTNDRVSFNGIPISRVSYSTAYYDGADRKLQRGHCAPWKGLDLQRVRLPPGNLIVPAGSNRSGGGGNEAVGAFDAKDRHSGPASR